MLTPAFEVAQDDQFVIINIKVPYGKVADIEIFAENQEFIFHMRPYFLRLHLPGEVIEDGRESIALDIEKGVCKVQLPKLHDGEYFENLDLLTGLLAQPKRFKSNRPLIEVIGDDSGSSHIDLETEGEEFSCIFKQAPIEQDTTLLSLSGAKYGFANNFSGVFTSLQENLSEAIDVPEPEQMTANERLTARIAEENQYFDEEHYMADFIENDPILSIIHFLTPWQAAYKVIVKNDCKEGEATHADESTDKSSLFTADEKQQLRELPNTEYLLDKYEEYRLLLGLVDIIYAYAYNFRTTGGENTVESSWTICKLSPTLSWLEVYSSNQLEDVVKACIRRALCFPLYRNWDLAQTVFADVKCIFQLGKRYLLKCLLEVHRLLKEHEYKYVLNNIFITDYCVWIQKLSKGKIRFISRKLNEMIQTKDNVGWDISLLEEAALATRNEFCQDSSSSETTSSEESSSESSCSDLIAY